MQAVGVLKLHQEDLPGHLSQQGGDGCSLTDCMQAGPRRTRDHAGWGQVKTEQRRLVNAWSSRNRHSIIHGHHGQL